MITLGSPREKFWGALLGLTAAGPILRGIELNCFEDFVAQLCAGEPVTAGEVFFPMHRVERIELDAPAGAGHTSSLAQRFHQRTGRLPAALLASSQLPLEIGATLANAQSRFIHATLDAVEQDEKRAAAILGISVREMRSLLR